MRIDRASAGNHSPNNNIDEHLQAQAVENARLQVLQAELDTLKRLRAEAPDLQATVEALRLYVQSHPESILGHLGLSTALQEIGETTEAVTVIREALRLADKACDIGERKVGQTVMIHLGLGRALHLNRQWSEAEAEYRFVATYDDGSVPLASLALLRLGKMFNEIGRRADAHKAWKEAIRRDIMGDVKRQANALLQANP